MNDSTDFIFASSHREAVDYIDDVLGYKRGHRNIIVVGGKDLRGRRLAGGDSLHFTSQFTSNPLAREICAQIAYHCGLLGVAPARFWLPVERMEDWLHTFVDLPPALDRESLEQWLAG